jgi:hypothetical protein
VTDAFATLALTCPTKVEISTFFNLAKTHHVQINWEDNIDLLNSLEKKELKQAY